MRGKSTKGKRVEDKRRTEVGEVDDEEDGEEDEEVEKEEDFDDGAIL